MFLELTSGLLAECSPNLAMMGLLLFGASGRTDAAEVSALCSGALNGGSNFDVKSAREKTVAGHVGQEPPANLIPVST